ncbi:hypothetical protein PUR71_31330 [Streptomyces sp. SP17BM10]|uniref:hypothetical protein n=1 Tax=Streptomyces sp. SP17BM10 TaxID=3002530 RepID=UPI002E75C1C0|nr:hypothetical protein [Streptomyces sp. SP17BM10]MEE1787361.1 hypothetical protein [Streptomyces sp. SP17BM10]
MTRLPVRLPAGLSPAEAVLTVSGWVALAATTLPAPLLPLRAVVVAAFLLLCPGAAALRVTHAVRAGRRRDPLEAVVLTVAFSIAIDTAVAEVFFFTRSISTARAVGAVALITSLLVLVPAAVRHRGRAAAPTADRPSGGRPPA